MREGVEVFIDYEKISGGQSLPRRINSGLEWCDTLVLLWSAYSAQSDWVSLEWENALQLQKQIIPCMLDATELPAVMRRLLYLDFTSYETGYPKLCRSLGVQPNLGEIKAPLPPQHVDLSNPLSAPAQSRVEQSENRTPPKAQRHKPISVPSGKKSQWAEPTSRPTPITKTAKIAATVTIIAIAIFLIWQVASQEPAKQTSEAAQSDSTLTQQKPQQIARPFRDKPATLSRAQVKTMLQRFDFYCRQYENSNEEFSNPQGRGFANQFEKQQGGKVVFDRASGLTWQQAGSDNPMTFPDAEKYVLDLNAKNFADHNDWRLPTLEEAMSLMEREMKNRDLYIDPVFDSKQSWFWTADKYSASSMWYVSFNFPTCHRYVIRVEIFVRAVR
jgi:serine/threonine-protein kinase